MPGIDDDRAGEMKEGRDEGAGVSRPVDGEGGDCPGCDEASDVAAVKGDGEAGAAGGTVYADASAPSLGCENSDDDDESGSPSPPGPARFSLPDSPPVESLRSPDGFFSGLTPALLPRRAFLGLLLCEPWRVEGREDSPASLAGLALEGLTLALIEAPNPPPLEGSSSPKRSTRPRADAAGGGGPVPLTSLGRGVRRGLAGDGE